MTKVEGSELLELPRSEVWRLLNNPEVLGRSIPGCRGFERDPDAEHRYRTAITVAVGIVSGVYEGSVSYLDVEEPERCTIVVSGRGDKGTIEGRGMITLAERVQRTEVAYRGDFKITGPVAGVGQRLAPGISRKMIVETLRNLEREGAGTAATAGPPGATAAAAEQSGPAGEPDANAGDAGQVSRREAEVAFKPFAISPPAAFAAGCALGLVAGLLIAGAL